MELTYTKCGDYQLPDLTLPEQPDIGKYGMLCKTFLKMHRPAIYTTFLFSGQLQGHLAEIDATARRRIDLITAQMAEIQGVTEELKARDQMAWVGRMNAIRQAAEEIVLTEVVYL